PLHPSSFTPCPRTPRALHSFPTRRSSDLALDVGAEDGGEPTLDAGRTHGARPASRARTRAGVTGVSVIRTSNGASASSIALAMAAGGEMAPPSPSPLAPSGLRGDGNSRWTVSIGGRSSAFGTA